MSQDALNAQLRRIEQALGGTLFRRDGDRLVLTDLGRFFVQGARNVVSRFEALQRHSERLLRSAGDSVRIVAAHAELIEELTDAVHQCLPSHRIALKEATSVAALGMLGTGEEDIAVVIRYGDTAMRVPDGVHAKVIVEAEPAFVGMSATHPLAGRAELDLAELRDQEWILVAPHDNSGRYGTFRRGCRAAGFEPLVHHDLSDWEATVILMRQGRGIGLVSPLRPAPDGLVYLPLAGNPQHRDLLLCWRADDKVAVHANEILEDLVRRYVLAVHATPVYRDWWLRHRVST
jgi:DNA-binding transcriptional LysR family regulator